MYVCYSGEQCERTYVVVRVVLGGVRAARAGLAAPRAPHRRRPAGAHAAADGPRAQGGPRAHLLRER